VLVHAVSARATSRAVKPWTVLERIQTKEGHLELRQRGARDFLITEGGRVVMTSSARRSEEDLARLALASLKGDNPHVMIGGLGMAYTVRAALDVLPPRAQLTVVELNGDVVRWCRGPLAPLTQAAVEDRRVKVVVADVSLAVRNTPPRALDAIVLDLYEGPHGAINRGDHPLYGDRAISEALMALKPQGVYAVWAEEPDAVFERRLSRAGATVTKHRSGKGGRQHVVYLAQPPRTVRLARDPLASHTGEAAKSQGRSGRKSDKRGSVRGGARPGGRRGERPGSRHEGPGRPSRGGGRSAGGGRRSKRSH